MSRLSRRSLLGLGALVGAGGVVGAAPAVASAAPAARAGSLTLHGRALRRLTGTGPAAAGDAHSVRGDLADSATAASRGEVFHTGHVVARTGAGHADDVATVEQHLFVLPEGTLAGSGTVTHAGRGTFVVTGGTGRFAGARGGYTTEQSADAAGGGSAQYRFDLTTTT